nr:unnamed protein product [Callosobruchus chinensis]
MWKILCAESAGRQLKLRNTSSSIVLPCAEEEARIWKLSRREEDRVTRAFPATKSAIVSGYVEDVWTLRDMFNMSKLKIYDKWKEKWQYIVSNKQKLPTRIPHVFEYNENREYSVIISRLKTNHGNFPAHLAKIGLIESPICDEDQEYADLNHLFFMCTKNKNAIEVFMDKLKSIGYQYPLNINTLLASGRKDALVGSAMNACPGTKVMCFFRPLVISISYTSDTPWTLIHTNMPPVGTSQSQRPFSTFNLLTLSRNVLQSRVQDSSLQAKLRPILENNVDFLERESHFIRHALSKGNRLLWSIVLTFGCNEETISYYKISQFQRLVKDGVNPSVVLKPSSMAHTSAGHKEFKEACRCVGKLETFSSSSDQPYGSPHQHDAGVCSVQMKVCSFFSMKLAFHRNKTFNIRHDRFQLLIKGSSVHFGSFFDGALTDVANNSIVSVLKITNA